MTVPLTKKTIITVFLIAVGLLALSIGAGWLSDVIKANTGGSNTGGYSNLLVQQHRPTLEDRVKALEMEVSVQRDQIVILHEEIAQQEELREEAVFGLWEVINVTELRCEQCLHECGGID